MKDIFKKEIARVFTDKKMVFSLFILPLIVVVGLFWLMGTLMGNMVSDVEEHKSVIYVQNPPKEVKEIISQSGYGEKATITYLGEEASQDEIDNIRAQILKGEVDLVVVFDSEFMKSAADYQNEEDKLPQVTIGYNSSESYSSAAMSLFDGMVLSALETVVLHERLGNLDLLTAFQKNVDLIVDEKKASGEYLATLLPYMMVFMLFSSAMSVCIDAITGEKERGTMASMLLSPVRRGSIVSGKLIALSVLSIMSSIVYAGATIISMPLMNKGMGGEESELVNVAFSPLQIVALAMLMISLVLLFVAVICLISVFAKTVKEANAYVMPLQMLVMVVGLLVMLSGSADPKQSSYAIPVYGTAISIQGVLTYEINIAQFGVSVLSNLICTVLIVFAISKVFNNEKIMLNA